MQVIASVFDMQSTAVNLRSKGRLIGLVPTMGALHEGHLSLIRLAKERADTVVVSIFVNPVQFGPSEDYAKYPRDLPRDLALCEKTGADIVFTPTVDELYPRGYSTYITEELISKSLCGVSRPTHFRGVTTIVVKLFNIVRPDIAVFGQKDAQQVAVVKKMVNDLHCCIDIVTAPTVREPDGLVLSSRNRYLTASQREEALIIWQALKRAKEMVDGGVRSVDRLVAEATHLMGTRRRVRVIYVAVVDRCTMEAVREVLPGKAMMAIAAWVDEVRLIDNMLL
jgi:pantoate--beta-alanine ligase